MTDEREEVILRVLKTACLLVQPIARCWPVQAAEVLHLLIRQPLSRPRILLTTQSDELSPRGLSEASSVVIDHKQHERILN